jgi:hypothetical protein
MEGYVFHGERLSRPELKADTLESRTSISERQPRIPALVTRYTRNVDAASSNGFQFCGWEVMPDAADKPYLPAEFRDGDSRVKRAAPNDVLEIARVAADVIESYLADCYNVVRLGTISHLYEVLVAVATD